MQSQYLAAELIACLQKPFTQPQVQPRPVVGVAGAEAAWPAFGALAGGTLQAMPV
jgi:hypothetical protein